MHSPLILIYHIPKTAGLSLRTYLQDGLSDDQFCLLKPAANSPGNETGSRSNLASLPIKTKSSLKAVMGHEVSFATKDFFPNRQHLFSTVIREPTGRIASNINYALSRIATGDAEYFSNFPNVQDRQRFAAQLYAGERPTELCIEQYIKVQQARSGWPNFQCFWLVAGFSKMIDVSSDQSLAKYAMEILKKFWLVGTFERLSHYMHRLARELNLPPFDIHHNKSIKQICESEMREHLAPYDFSHDNEIHSRYNRD